MVQKLSNGLLNVEGRMRTKENKMPNIIECQWKYKLAKVIFRGYDDGCHAVTTLQAHIASILLPSDDLKRYISTQTLYYG